MRPDTTCPECQGTGSIGADAKAQCSNCGGKGEVVAMERNVVSLETAKKLKAAGFPQETLWIWVQPDQAKPWLTIRDQIVRNGKGLVRTWAAAPEAQEIADQLDPCRYVKEAGYNGLLTIKHGPKDIPGWRQKGARAWGAAYFVGGEHFEPIGMGDSLAEAVAELWLKLEKASGGTKMRLDG